MSVLSARIPDALSERLDALAQATGRNKSFLTEQAVAEYIAREEWQVAEIRAAIKEADAGDFATDEETSAVFDKWVKREG